MKLNLGKKLNIKVISAFFGVCVFFGTISPHTTYAEGYYLKSKNDEISIYAKYLKKEEKSAFNNEKGIHKIEAEKVDREATLRKFFKKHNSPLENSAGTFVEVADKYGLDYRLLPAIAGMESTFCKFTLLESHNCYGWGIYGNNAIYFKSYDEGINVVAEGIYKGYVAKGADTVEKMAPIYTPPNYVKWLAGVKYFMNEIDKVQAI